MLSSLLSSSTRRAHVDFAETFASLDSLFYARGLRPTVIGPDLVAARGRLGVAMAVKAFAGERVARAVVTHVSARPLFAGLSIVIHPKPEWNIPMLLADARVVPSGVTHAFVDACGCTKGEFDVLFRKPLAQTLDAVVASAVRRKRLPTWLDRITAGAGAELAANRGRGHVIGYALLRYVERWLDGAARATEAASAEDNTLAARAVCDAVRTHGRGGKMVIRAFGPAFASRYAALVWNTDSEARSE
jgi:hypothetical protein